MAFGKWEEVEHHGERDDGGDTYRMEVPGGWIYRIREYDTGSSVDMSPALAVSTIFVAEKGSVGSVELTGRTIDRLTAALRQAINA